MRQLTRCSVAAMLLSVSGALLPAQQRASSPIDGAWRHLRTEVVTPDSTYQRPALQGMIILAGRHYSQLFVRPSPSGVQQASQPTTTEEKAARYDVLTANAGTFEVRDTLITYRVEHAKNPRFVGTTRVARYRLKGDTLWSVFLDPWVKDSTKTVRTTITNVRVRQ
jgi:hypothetical protein